MRRRDSAYGGNDSDARAPSQQPIVGEEREKATPESVLRFDVHGEARSGGGVRRRLRRARVRTGERRGGGGVVVFLQKRSWLFM